MSTDTVRAVLSILIVGTLMMIVAVLMIIPSSSGYQDAELARQAAWKIVSVMSGLTGVILGYYFAK
ncbi:MAG: hypothetical protein AAF735_07520 [Myxococcota bacterium]